MKSTFKNKFNKYKNEFLPTFSKKFKNINLSDISEDNKEKYKKSNIRIYQVFLNLKFKIYSLFSRILS